MRTPLAPIALAFAAGVAGADALAAPGWWLLWLVAVAVAGVLLLVDRLAWSAAALLAAVLALGALRAVPAPLPVDDVARLGLPREARVEGRIVSEPVRLGPERRRVVLETTAVDGAPRSGRMQVTLYGGGRPVHEGQGLWVNARLRRATSAHNPDGFDYARFLARDGIHVIGTASARDVTVLDPSTPWHAEVRRRALAAIERVLPPVSASLLGGLLLGARGDLPADVLDGFRRAGVYHVLAVSGFNVALVAAAAFTAALLARTSRRKAAISAIVFVLGFAAVVGPEPSVLRATIMAVLVLLALLLEREASVVNSLALAALLILAVRPADLADPGFQLSFAATLGIVVAPLPRGPVLGTMAVSLAAQLAVLPVTLAHFNQVSTVGIVANLGVVPLAGLATVLGVTAVGSSMLSDIVAGAFLDATWPVLLLLRGVVRLAASVPGAVAHLPAPHWLAIAAYALGLAAVLTCWTARATRPRVSAVAGALGFWLLAGAIAVGAWPLVRPGDGRLHITVLDVARGQAIVAEAPDRATLVLVAGTRPDAADRVVAPYLWNRGVRRLAGVVAAADARGTADRLRQLFPVAAPGGDVRLGAVTVDIIRDAASDAGRVTLGYGLASIVVVLDPHAAGSDVPPDATLVVLRAHEATRRMLARSGSTISVLSSGSGERFEIEPIEDSASARGVRYRTDRDGAVLAETDGRRLLVTRWATRAIDRYCLDPESACPERPRF